jgi:hypothetical protein
MHSDEELSVSLSFSCAASFGIRAGILPQLATDFNLSGEQLEH